MRSWENRLGPTRARQSSGEYDRRFMEIIRITYLSGRVSRVFNPERGDSIKIEGSQGGSGVSLSIKV